jgi:hypothetical protein
VCTFQKFPDNIEVLWSPVEREVYRFLLLGIEQSRAPIRNPATTVVYMANQAGSGQPWQHVGSYPGDGNDQPLTPQTFDIGTPPDLSGSLKSLDASSSDLPSSVQKSTLPTPMSDVIFGSDKPDLIGGYDGFNTGAKVPSNSMFGDVISAGVSASGSWDPLG